jgi:hypothetical protein
MRKLQNASPRKIRSLLEWFSLAEKITTNKLGLGYKVEEVSEMKKLKGTLLEDDLFCVNQEEMTALERYLAPFVWLFSLLLGRVLARMSERPPDKPRWKWMLVGLLESWASKRGLKFHWKGEPVGKNSTEDGNPESSLRQRDHDLRVQAASRGITQGIAKVVLMAMGVGMLIAPIWVLYSVHDPEVKLGVITGFIIAFLLIVAFSTKADVSASLVATAG